MPYRNVIPAIYLRNFDNLGLFFFVNGVRSALPTVSTREAVRLYAEFVDDPDLNEDSAAVTVSKMSTELKKSKIWKRKIPAIPAGNAR